MTGSTISWGTLSSVRSESRSGGPTNSRKSASGGTGNPRLSIARQTLEAMPSSASKSVPSRSKATAS